MTRIVLDVLSLKAEDSRPTLEMSVDELNEADDQPTDTSSFDGYDAAMFESAERIEFHLDYVSNPGPDPLHVVDGREATWDSQSETVSVELERDDTVRTGRYAFEWVLVYDEGAPISDNADKVASVPNAGFFGLHVSGKSERDLEAVDAPERRVGDLTVDGTATVLNAPTAADHAARKAEVDQKADKDHDHSGEAISPDRVSASEINNRLEVPDGDSEALAEALQLAEDQPGIQIIVGKGDYYPADYGTLPFNIRESTVIKGHHPGFDNTGRSPDRLIPNEGTHIDCNGETLIDTSEVAGIQIEGIGFTNFKHVIRCGQHTNNGDPLRGLMQSSLRDLAFWEGTDYPLKLYNFQRLRLDKIVAARCPGLLHAIGGMDLFEPGNSVWTDIHVTPDADSTVPSIHIQGDTTQINYITMVRPQVIINRDGDAQGTALKFEGNKDTGSPANAMKVIAGDFEGAFDRYVDMQFSTKGVVEYAHNRMEGSYGAYVDADSRFNEIHQLDKAPVWCNSLTTRVEGEVDGIEGDAGNSGGRFYGLVYDHQRSEEFTLYTGFPGKRMAFGQNMIEHDGRALTAERGLKSRMDRDLSSYSPLSTEHGVQYYHTGADGNPAGYYWWDENGDVSPGSWIRVGDNSTTITP